MSGFCRCGARGAVRKRSQPASCAMAISLVPPSCGVNSFTCIFLLIVGGLVFGYNVVYNSKPISLHSRPSFSTAHRRCASATVNSANRHPLAVQTNVNGCKPDGITDTGVGGGHNAFDEILRRPQFTGNPKAKPADQTWESQRIDRLEKLSPSYRQGLPQEAVSQVRTLLLFVGYPRSCHSLVGSLLDAHRNMVVAHEYNLLKRWKDMPSSKQTNRSYILNELYQQSKKEARDGVRRLVPGSEEALKEPDKYYYGVEKQWQGTYNNDLLVAGDKRGGLTSLLVSREKDRGLDVIQKMADSIGLPVRFIHVVRNPYDNIATMLLRQTNKRKPSEQRAMGKVSINWHSQLSKTKRFFNRLVKTVENVRIRYPVLDVHCERLIKDPKIVLEKVCEYLNLTCSTSYLDACSRIVKKAPSRTRDFIRWPAGLREFIDGEMRKHAFLQNYTFAN